jgi:hypothetical protein
MGNVAKFVLCIIVPQAEKQQAFNGVFADIIAVGRPGG